jgi:hypothetical protein
MLNTRFSQHGNKGVSLTQVLAISIPSGETAVLRHFQERMPCGLFVPDVEAGKSEFRSV